MKNKKVEWLAVLLILVIQTVIYVVCGINKSYIHMDEAYSLGLAGYNKVEIQENEDFYNNWHNKEYYDDYLSIQEDEKGKYSQVYENQKNDVHPPLYYLLLRISMGAINKTYNKWAGIIVNIIIYAFITIFNYLILKKLIGEGEEHLHEKALLLAFVSSITLASLTCAIYIRMYALSALNIAITTYLHIKLLESKKKNYKLLACIGISALVGSLTHYYYLFYLAMMYILFIIKYIKEKDYKQLISYTVAMVIAAVASLLIFPYSIQHIFFGYRGQGVLSKLIDIKQFAIDIAAYILKINRFGFNNSLIIVVAIILGILGYKRKNKVGKSSKSEYLKYITIPSLFYFFLVAVASPWVELRYIMPICGIMFILVIYYLYKILKDVVKPKSAEIATISILVIILIAPFIFNIEPEVAYSDKKEIVQQLEGELNLPTLFLFNSNNNRFLDDILLFAKLNESYIAKDLDVTEEKVAKILESKDTSKGMIVFINEGQENDELLEVIEKVTNLDSKYLKRLNACDVYYLK